VKKIYTAFAIKQHCFLLLLFSLALQLSAQNKGVSSSFDPHTVDLDSAVNWLENNRWEKNPDFPTISHKISQFALQKKEYNQLGRIHLYTSSWHYFNNISQVADSIIGHQKLSITYYEMAKNFDAAHEMYLGLAADYMNNDELAKAEEVIIKAIQYFEKKNNEFWLAESHARMAEFSLVTDEPEKTIEYINKCLPIFLEHKDYLRVSSLLISYGSAYDILEDYEAAISHFDRCIEICVSNDFNQNKDVLVVAYRRKGEIYFDQEKYDQALSYFIKAWEENNVLGGREKGDFFRFSIGNTLLLQEKYEEALPHLIAGINARKHSEIDLHSDLYLALSNCYEKLGNYSMAIENRDIAMKIDEKKYKNQIDALKSELNIKYDTEKKDEAIAAQELILKQKNNVQKLMIGIGVLLLIVLGLVLYFLKNSKKATQIIKAKNSENELLLKEIHHRVKNNLEMVKSLIALQSAQLEDSATKDAMIASQNRVQSMGIIHQKLYQGTNLGSIEMKDYFMNLGEGILDSFNAEDQVIIACAMEDLELDVDTAVPIGLIVNELLTNSLKYAFPEGKKGQIKISLTKVNDNTLTLKVADNGVGKTQGLPAKGTGFGSQLVHLLTQQLNGSLQEETTAGTTTSFEFKLDTAA
jgi:two-component sensor histidine kinase